MQQLVSEADLNSSPWCWGSSAHHRHDSVLKGPLGSPASPGGTCPQGWLDMRGGSSRWHARTL